VLVLQKALQLAKVLSFELSKETGLFLSYPRRPQLIVLEGEGLEDEDLVEAVVLVDRVDSVDLLVVDIIDTEEVVPTHNRS
jgi:hypothetical protein